MMEGMMTDPQRKMLFSQMEKGNVDKEEMETFLGFSISELSKNEASMLIDCFIKNGDLGEVMKKIKENRKANPEATPESKPMVNPPSNVSNLPKTEFKVQAGSELALAKTAGIPEEMANLFFMKLNENAYIKENNYKNIVVPTRSKKTNADKLYLKNKKIHAYYC